MSVARLAVQWITAVAVSLLVYLKCALRRAAGQRPKRWLLCCVDANSASFGVKYPVTQRCTAASLRFELVFGSFVGVLALVLGVGIFRAARVGLRLGSLLECDCWSGGRTGRSLELVIAPAFGSLLL